MSNEKAKPAGLKGLWDVSDLAGDPPVKPSAEQTAAARQVGERLGFVFARGSAFARTTS